MPWDIEDRENAAIVTMNSNSVGTMNSGFFADLNSAFLSLKKNSSGKPVVLCSGVKMFSPGLDLEHCVSLFKRGDKTEIDRWFEDFLNAMLTVFNHSAPVAAAIGGHTIAGGCILALCCDTRIAEKGKTLLGLNETSIGFPMPCSLTALVEGVLGEKEGGKIIGEGKLHSVEQALENGLINCVAEPETVVSKALKEVQKLNSGDFTKLKKAQNGKISKSIRKAFADEDSKTLAGKLSSAETVGKLEGLIETLKKGRKQ
ncbi:enoyl-CoA hydratase/isomerase family protein [Candidatus Mycalebacterium sp.]